MRPPAAAWHQARMELLLVGGLGVIVLAKAITAHRASAPYVFSWWDGGHGAALKGKPVRAVWMIVIAALYLFVVGFVALGALLAPTAK